MQGKIVALEINLLIDTILQHTNYQNHLVTRPMHLNIG